MGPMVVDIFLDRQTDKQDIYVYYKQGQRIIKAGHNIIRNYSNIFPNFHINQN